MKSSVMPLITTETREVTLSRYVTLKLDFESQGRKFWAVAETCIHYPLQDAISLADLYESSILISTKIVGCSSMDHEQEAHTANLRFSTKVATYCFCIYCVSSRT